MVRQHPRPVAAFVVAPHQRGEQALGAPVLAGGEGFVDVSWKTLHERLLPPDHVGDRGGDFLVLVLEGVEQRPANRFALDPGHGRIDLAPELQAELGVSVGPFPQKNEEPIDGRRRPLLRELANLFECLRQPVLRLRLEHDALAFDRTIAPLDSREDSIAKAQHHVVPFLPLYRHVDLQTWTVRPELGQRPLEEVEVGVVFVEKVEVPSDLVRRVLIERSKIRVIADDTVEVRHDRTVWGTTAAVKLPQWSAGPVAARGVPPQPESNMKEARRSEGEGRRDPHTAAYSRSPKARTIHLALRSATRSMARWEGRLRMNRLTALMTVTLSIGCGPADPASDDGGSEGATGTSTTADDDDDGVDGTQDSGQDSDTGSGGGDASATGTGTTDGGATEDGTGGTADGGSGTTSGDETTGGTTGSGLCDPAPVPPGGGMCPGLCVNGCADDVCEIVCDSPDECQQIDCPEQFACDVTCEGADACDEGVVNCPDLACTLHCLAGTDACGDVVLNCGDGAPCELECDGQGGPCTGTAINCGSGQCTANCDTDLPPAINPGDSCEVIDNCQ